MKSLIRLAKKIRKNLAPRALVLMYHRIGSPQMDPWQLSVSEKNFDQQLAVLSNHWNVIPATALANDLLSGQVKNKSVVITFDDGYLDNYVTALPILEKYQKPASFFIPDHNIENNEPFWWDVLEDAVFNTEVLPEQLEASINNEMISFSLQGEDVLTENLKRQYQNWKGTEETSLKRCNLYLLLWAKLKALPPADQAKNVKLIRQVCNAAQSISAQLMNVSQLIELSKNPLFTIGAHTKDHVMLAAHSDSLQRHQIVDNREWLQTTLMNEVKLISYPYGNYNRDTEQIVAQSGFKAAFTTDPKAISKYSKQFSLGRFQVCDWNGAEFENQLMQWHKMSL